MRKSLQRVNLFVHNHACHPLYPQLTYALPPNQASCSDTEVQITRNQFTALRTVSVEIPAPATDDEQCKDTFSTEAATSEPETRLLVLGYTFFFPGTTPSDFVCAPLNGPILTRIPDGFDETHTFITIFENTESPHGPILIAPCISSAFGGQFRLRRHCLTIECQTK